MLSAEDIGFELWSMVVRGNIDFKRFNRELSYLQEHSWLESFFYLMQCLKKKGESGKKNNANSYIAWAIGVTDVAPSFDDESLKPVVSGSMPDVDIDFEPRKRDQVLSYIQERYGGYRIGSFMENSDKKVFRDVARTYEMKPSKVNEISKDIEILEDLDFRSAELGVILDKAKVFRGLLGGLGTHAAGVVATQVLLPIRIDKHGEIVTQYDKDILENLNAVKFDILGVSYLNVIADMFSFTGLNYDTINYEDSEVYKSMLKSTIGVFQFESGGMRKLIKDIKPSNIEELSAISALFRPGPLKAGLTDKYAEGKWGRSVTPVPEAFKPVLSRTYNVLVFQEQIIDICKLVGFSPTEADNFRRKVSKAKAGDEAKLAKFFAEVRDEFEQKSNENGIDIYYTDEDGANVSYYEVIEKMAGYAFNCSHSISYALVSYVCAYLKHHYPVLYALCLLNSFPDKLEDLIRDGGIKFLKPDVNKSKDVIVQDGDALRLPLTFIKGIGATAKAIINGQPYSSLDDFKIRLMLKGNILVKKNVYESLCRYGSLECLGVEGVESIEQLKVVESLETFKKYDNFGVAASGSQCFISGYLQNIKFDKTSTKKDCLKLTLRGINNYTVMIIDDYNLLDLLVKKIEPHINDVIVAKVKKLENGKFLVFGSIKKVKTLKEILEAPKK